jgi:hypothetical protein
LTARGSFGVLLELLVCNKDIYCCFSNMMRVGGTKLTRLILNSKGRGLQTEQQ